MIKVVLSKKVAMESANVFFEMKEGYKDSSVKIFNVSLNYKEVGISLKYSTPHSLWKLVKMG